jgi:mRNA interferase MazF
MAAVPTPKPVRGEIWLVNFDPATGAEIQKLRPALVMSIDSVGRLPLRIVTPITDWKPDYAKYAWFVSIPATPGNGLSKHSGADAFQTKSLSVSRFTRRLGTLTETQMAAVSDAIAICVGA